VTDHREGPPADGLRRARSLVVELLQREDGPQDPSRRLLRYALAAFLAVAGVGHLVNTEAFLAQVPPYLPAPTLLVLVSGVVEIALAVALIRLPHRRAAVGLAVLVLFLAVLPGNVAQYTEARDAFGLDTDAARLTRVLLSPLLWFWALAAGDIWPRPRGRVSR
jgi:uncharacterized membrane protein